MKKLIVGLLVIGGGVLVCPAYAQVGVKKTPDQRVEKLLQEAELKYKVDEDGDFMLGNRLEGERTQLAWILSNTSQLGSLEIRQIWSIGY
ncbi:MAG TPA: hypothetical protein PLQ00_01935, partial [Thermoguttaceae bacterium]|nr:hypothetical protein [Thermoguttaceae bacterium]